MHTKLDKTDRAILDILTKHGRESYTTLSKKLSFSDTGIKKRLYKLNNEGILKVQGNLNLDALHLKACLILLEVKGHDDLNRIIKAYENCPYVFLTLELLGNYNLLMGFYGHNIEDVDEKIKDCGPSNMPGVLHSEVMLISNFNLPTFLPLKIVSADQQVKINVCERCSDCLNKL